MLDFIIIMTVTLVVTGSLIGVAINMGIMHTKFRTLITGCLTGRGCHLIGGCYMEV